ncbi:MAG: tetratricopeptide repeat protein, partial [bacterium]|nr:tetratricopeptide repeat protein [bacterium]
EKTALFALSAASCLLTIYAAATWGAVGHETITYPLGTRISVAVVGYTAYLYKTVWPMHLAAYYPHPGAAFSLWQVGGAAILLIVITAAALAARRRAPYVLVGWLWFIVSLVPVIGVVQVGRHWIADRYTYVPVVGLFIALTWLATDLSGRGPRRQHGPATVAAVLIAAFALLSSAQVRVWRNSEALWNHAIRVAPGNYLAHGNLGSHLAKQGRLDEAIPHFANAIKLEPSFVTAYYNLGLALMIQDRPEEALGPLGSAVKLKADHVEAHVLLGQAHLALGQRREAAAVLEQALRLRPRHATVQALLDQVRGTE